LEYPRSSYVAELIGVNFFRGRIMRYETDGTCVIALQNSEYRPFEIFAALSEQGQESAPNIGEEAYVVVNPRSVTLYQSPPDASARNLFPGTITQILRLRSGGVQSRDGYVRVSLALDGLSNEFPPLTAEITEASATRLKLQQQQRIYAAFKATEASAYS
jgi:molybdate transport system ATP-binding protein